MATARERLEELRGLQDNPARARLTELRQTQEPQRSLGRRGFRAPVDQGQDAFAGLTQETEEQIKEETPITGRGIGGVQAARRRLGNLERLRQVNPALAQEIEEMPQGQAFLIGAGKAVEDVSQGVQRLFGALDQEGAARDEEAFQQLAGIKGIANLGELAGQTALFAAPSSLAARIPGAVGTAATAATAGIESGLDVAGEGGTPEEIAKGAALGATVGGVANKLFSAGKLTGKQKGIVDELRANPTNPKLAKFLEVDGKPVVSQQLKQAANDFGGVKGQEFVAIAKNASKQDKNAVKEMLGIVKKGMVDPVFRDVNNVGQVVGNSLRRRVIAIRSLNNQAGKKIDDIARNQLKGNKVDLTTARDNFKQAMDDLRVDYDPVKGTVKFKDSALEGAGAGSSRDLITRLAKRLKNTDMDAADAHFMKRLIDKEVTWTKTPGGLAGDIDDSVKALRGDVNDSIRNISKSYRDANVQYKDTIEAMDNLQTAAGRNVNLESDKALGVSLRRLTNNTVARDKLINSMDEIEEVSRKYGKNFQDNILTQNHLANSIESRFKVAGDTSAQGLIDQAVSQVSKSNLERLAGGVRTVAEKVGQSNDEKTINSLLEILNGQ